MLDILPIEFKKERKGPLVIKVESIVKEFGKFRVLDGIELRVGKGEIYGLLGPNGAGKTTLINILCCQLPPTRGEASIGGFSIVDQKDRVRRIIGLVPQEVSLYKKLTVEENLRIMGSLQGLRGKELQSKIEELLEWAGLSKFSSRLAGDCSVGMRQALNIAMGLIHSPQALFLDEPTSGLDPLARKSLWELIKGLSGRGSTLVIATHNLLEAEKLCDRIGILNHGKIAMEDTPRQIRSKLTEAQATVELGEITLGELKEAVRRLNLEITSVHGKAVTIVGPEIREKIEIIIGRMPELKLINVEDYNLEDAFIKFIESEAKR